MDSSSQLRAALLLIFIVWICGCNNAEPLAAPVDSAIRPRHASGAPSQASVKRLVQAGASDSSIEKKQTKPSVEGKKPSEKAGPSSSTKNAGTPAGSGPSKNGTSRRPRFKMRGVIPGLSSVLMLTKEQHAKIREIQKKAMESPKLIAARKTLTNKNATREERNSAAKVFREIDVQMKKKMVGILTPEQRETQRKMDEAFRKSIAETQKEYRARYPAVKNDPSKVAALQREMMNKTVALFFGTINKFLTPEQKKALQAASDRVRAQIERAKAKAKAKASKAPFKGAPMPDLN